MQILQVLISLSEIKTLDFLKNLNFTFFLIPIRFFSYPFFWKFIQINVYYSFLRRHKFLMSYVIYLQQYMLLVFYSHMLINMFDSVFTPDLFKISL